MIRKFAVAAVAVLAVAFSAGSAKAAHQIQSGDTVGGWKISIPANQGLELINDDDSNITIQIEKFADFDDMNSKVFTFVQASANPVKTIRILDEHITNTSNKAWTSFQELLVDTTTNATFTGTGFTNTEMLTKSTLSSDKTSLVLSGGVINDGDTANWGGSGHGELDINAPLSTQFSHAVFSLKEIPGGGTPIVPVPAAAWTGLTGLAGLALTGAGKKIRRILA
jgi:hypothetical protein